MEASLDITMDCEDENDYYQCFKRELNEYTDVDAVLDHPDDAENDPDFQYPEEVNHDDLPNKKNYQSVLRELNEATDVDAVLDYPVDTENDPDYHYPDEVDPNDLLNEKIWRSFVRELSESADVDAENDPEYHYPDEVDPNDLRNKKTWRSFVRELRESTADDIGDLELPQMDLSFLDDEDKEEKPRISMEFLENVGPSPEINLGPVCVENVNTIWMTSDEKLQLDEQMRMYVQLVSQSYLLSHENSALQNFNASTKIILEEIKMFATREISNGKSSAFYAQNLDGALDIVNEFEKINLHLNTKNMKQSNCKLPSVPHHIQKTLATNKVFIYPELLPTCGFCSIVEICRSFNTPEDNLISLGLEQFSILPNPVQTIQEYLLPTKSVQGIKSRIKNCKIKRDHLTNSIKYFYKNHQAPKFQRVIRIFDPNNIKAPEDYPPEFLPKWMQQYSKLPSSQPVSVPSQLPKPSSGANAAPPPFSKALQPRASVHILPQVLNSSSHEQTQPTLKMYSQRRHKKPINRTPYVLCPSKPKPGPSDFSTNAVSSTTLKTLKRTGNRDAISLDSSLSAEYKICSIPKEGDAFVPNHSVVATHPVIKNFNFKSDGQEKSTCKPSIAKSSKENYNINQVSEKSYNDANIPKVSVSKATTTTKNKSSTASRRDLDASLALLQSAVVNDASTKGQEVMFANSYLLRAIEILKDDPEVCEKFLVTLSKYHQNMRSPVELYSELKKTLKNYPALVRDSIVLLQPEQAKQCGRYKEHIALSKTRNFFKKIEIYFKNEPQLLNQIMIKYAQLRDQVDITSSEIIGALQPLLKNHTLLINDLNNLLSSPK